MPPIGVALYGPPASGKDTITRALTELDARYVHYLRLKAGSGRSDGTVRARTRRSSSCETAG
ncbi:MAG: hypothetical protein ACRDLN_00705 [Solirubrobacteraceae bacterium]